jgi:alkylation response protein AidB-like acyl-CoA dehydrogenase
MNLVIDPPKSSDVSISTNDRSKVLEKVREISQTDLAAIVEACDQEGLYPEAVLKRLGEAGAFSAHLDIDGEIDYGLAIQCMSEVSRVCGSTGFMVWCQDACGLYIESSGNPLLMSDLLSTHAVGQTLGGTGLSNPMKALTGIETMYLKAERVDGGYLVNGTLPWVSNLGQKHYFGTICNLVDSTTKEPIPGHELMFMLHCDAPGVELKECPSFSGMEGTGTYAISVKNLLITEDKIITKSVRSLLRKIKSAFVLLQTGMGLGVTQGAIDSMWRVEKQLGHVNQYLEDRPDELQVELDDLTESIIELSKTPYDESKEYFIKVLDARLHVSELALRSAQSALMHQGARGYLMSSEVQRRVRESHFVAIVTPAIKHLRWELASQKAELSPA